MARKKLLTAKPPITTILTSNTEEGPASVMRLKQRRAKHKPRIPQTREGRYERMGAMTRICRTVPITICDCLYVDENNDTKQEQVKLYGDYTNIVRATNACKKKLNRTRVLVKNISKEEYSVSMPMEAFMENADHVTKKAKEN